MKHRVEARTIGAFEHEPAIDLNTNRARDRNLFYGIPAIGHYPFGGSAIVIWDAGPGLVEPPPVPNVAPADNRPARVRAQHARCTRSEVRLPRPQWHGRGRLRRQAMPYVQLHPLS